jgi:hypothetical protein
MNFEKPDNSSETEGQKAFSELRSRFYDSEKQSVKERAEKNPTPTDHELRIGAYEEEVEPQMRPILQALYEKGYTTESSGFGGIDNPEIQQVDGYYEIDNATEEKLKQLGAWITREHSDYYHDTLTRIEFKADEPDDEKITQKWEEIVSVLPVIGKPSYSLSAPSFEFQQKHMGEDEARKIHIETLLERGHMPDDEREGAEQWLKDYQERKAKFSPADKT